MPFPWILARSETWKSRSEFEFWSPIPFLTTISVTIITKLVSIVLESWRLYCINSCPQELYTAEASSWSSSALSLPSWTAHFQKPQPEPSSWNCTAFSLPSWTVHCRSLSLNPQPEVVQHLTYPHELYTAEASAWSLSLKLYSTQLAFINCT